MLKNILHLENVKTIDKKNQKSILAGSFSIGIYCGHGHPYCCSTCNKKGFVGGNLIRGICECFG